jgi:hypothetical protein
MALRVCLPESKEVPMNAAIPYVYINDDEIELKQILVLYGKLKKQRKLTVSEAEKRGLVRVESMPHAIADDNFSKSIAILDQKVRLCLSTKGLTS